MVITTPKLKAKVYIKDSLTFGEQRQLQKSIFDEIKVTPKDAETGNFLIPASVTFITQEKAFTLLVYKIELPVNNEYVEQTGNLLEIVNGWEIEDGRAVFEAVNKVTSAKKTEAEKKS